ncbi:ATP-binding protein [Streptomyces apocyni]|uniref:ATP-binding protein n=1 Tax=Streptomyces apocyni TaxID=2654677 RepID=UPI0018D17A84|nr:ATP-binding protein [Streptomyces apocyni]
MSHPREPAARADRREGGRHGRPGPRTGQPLPETLIRRQLLRGAILPAVAVALCGTGAVLFALRLTNARPTLAQWTVLAAAAAVACAGIAAAAVAAHRSTQAVLGRLTALRRSSARSQSELRGIVEGLRRGERPPARTTPAFPGPSADEFDLLAHELGRAHDVAVSSVVQAAQLSSHAGNEQKVEVFVNLARRLQSLVHREIQLLDELENEVEDPELLKGLFHVDHLATRIRRHAENLAVLGGAISRRQWSNPVTTTEVLRSAIAEVEQYSRVKLVPPIDGTLRGHAVADIIHLVAELVENASVFSAPHTQVLLRASYVTAGLAIEVEDRGLGMPVTEQNKMNTLLTDPDQVNVASLLSDGRIGLFVVASLARRHGVAVRLQTNIYGGVQAIVVLPQGLLGADQPQQGHQGQQGQQGQAGGRNGAQSSSVQQPSVAAPVPLAQDRAHAHPTPVGLPEPTQPSAAPPPPPAPARTVAPPPHSPVVRLPHQTQRDEALVAGGGPAAPPPANGTPLPANGTPLPLRAPHAERPTPADAVPGIRPEDRATAGEHTLADASADDAGRGERGRPRLPKRRAQEHMVPELRNGPVASARDSSHLVGHDPGLMAAFQRGIGLAEDLDQEPEPDIDPAQPSHHRQQRNEPAG